MRALKRSFLDRFTTGLVAACLALAAATAVPPTSLLAIGAAYGPVTVTPAVEGTGVQTDPHISGSVIAYTDRSSGTSQIRYLDLVTDIGGTVPPQFGTADLLSDISGTYIAFVRTDGINETGEIYVYNIATPFLPPVAIDATDSGGRGEASIGGNIVAFEDVTGVNRQIHAASATVPGDSWEIASTGHNYDPSVSADGSVIAYIGCNSADVDCNAMAATSGPATVSTNMGRTDGPAAGVDTNGTHVVFIRDGDLTWAPITGIIDATSEVALGTDRNPNISGTYVSYEHSDGTQTDIYFKDISSTDPALDLTNTPGMSEQLNDISVVGTSVRVVFARPGVDDSLDIYVATFEIQLDPDPEPAVPSDRDDCRSGGWQTAVREDGSGFKNQGDCTRYVNTGK